MADLDQAMIDKVFAIIMSKTKDDYVAVANIYRQIADQIEKAHDETTPQGRVRALNIRPLAEQATAAQASLVGMGMSFGGTEDKVGISMNLPDGQRVVWGSFSAGCDGKKKD